MEQADNGTDLRDLTLLSTPAWQPVRQGDITVLRGRARRRRWPGDALYRTTQSQRRVVALTAVPDCVWGNRAPGQEMLVWLNHE